MQTYRGEAFPVEGANIKVPWFIDKSANDKKDTVAQVSEIV